MYFNQITETDKSINYWKEKSKMTVYNIIVQQPKGLVLYVTGDDYKVSSKVDYYLTKKSIMSITIKKTQSDLPLKDALQILIGECKNDSIISATVIN